MDNIFFDSVRNSLELSYEEGEFNLELENPVLARSYDRNILDSIVPTMTAAAKAGKANETFTMIGK